ncbi:hypothetical protein APHAL10511_005626 [Amanita phalloides]|nr:hypothetical protein APHAL10511_005626 [Amanita phalloides]
MSRYRPRDSAYDVLMEKSFILSYFLTGMGYGVQFMLYVICASYLWKQRENLGRVVSLRLAYITILILLESLFAAATIWTTGDMFIVNRNYPGGPMAYFGATQDLPEDVTFIASLVILTFLSDLFMLWRCWIIWSTAGKLASYAAMSIPILTLLSSFALGTIWILESSQQGLSMFSKVPIAFGTAYYVISLNVNILVTVLIIMRLLFHRRAILNVLPVEYTKQYLSVAAIVVESALLYSIFALIFIITYAINNPMNPVFLCIASSCQQIAGYLIILRVSQGRAWTSDTLTMGKSCDASKLVFNSPVSTSQLEDIELRVNRCPNTLLDGFYWGFPSGIERRAAVLFDRRYPPESAADEMVSYFAFLLLSDGDSRMAPTDTQTKYYLSALLSVDFI